MLWLILIIVVLLLILDDEPLVLAGCVVYLSVYIAVIAGAIGLAAFSWFSWVG